MSRNAKCTIIVQDRVHSNQTVLETVRREAGSRERLPKAPNYKLAQGGPSGLSPLRSDGSRDGQAGGWTSREVAKDAQGRVGKQLKKTKGAGQKIGIMIA